MAQRIAFHYLPVDSVLHRWDARCKFCGLLMITATLLHPTLPWLIFCSLLFFSLLLLSRIPVKPFYRDLRYGCVLLLALSLIQAFFTSHSRNLLLPWLPVSREGLRLGTETFWRLGLILSFGILFSSVTRPREIQEAVAWFLKPLPFLPARRLGLAVSLTLRFFTVTLDQSEEVLLAQKARLGDRSRNPIRRIRTLGLPILRRSFIKAEEVTFALAARGYRDDLPVRQARISPVEWIPLPLLLGLAAAIHSISA